MHESRAVLKLVLWGASPGTNTPNQDHLLNRANDRQRPAVRESGAGLQACPATRPPDYAGPFLASRMNPIGDCPKRRPNKFPCISTRTRREVDCPPFFHSRLAPTPSRPVLRPTYPPRPVSRDRHSRQCRPQVPTTLFVVNPPYLPTRPKAEPKPPTKPPDLIPALGASPGTTTKPKPTLNWANDRSRGRSGAWGGPKTGRQAAGPRYDPANG